ncbi:MAG: hypothetical protein ACRENP_01200 [Longimicrobiales bacterium]
MRASSPTVVMVGAILCVGVTPALPAQERLVGPRVVSAAVSWQRWSFPTPIASDSLQVTGVDQLSIPFSASFTPLRNWQLDLSGAFASGTVSARSSAGASSALLLTGATDMRIRATGRVVGEQLWLTLGVGLPTGRVGLSDEETAALQVISAPALRMTTPVLGSGTGLTVGGVFTPVIGRWAVGLGLSYERRATYSPLEASLAGGGSVATELDPADVVHLSLGLDRIVGQGRISVLLVADRYGTDIVTLQSPTGTAAAGTSYQLGPTLFAHWQYEVATPALRQFRLFVSQRYRASFQDASGLSVAGSSGTAIDAGASATIGRARGVGVAVALDGAYDTGLAVDETVATARMSGAALSLGLDILVRRLVIRPYVRGSFHRIDPGMGVVNARGMAGGIALRAEW